MKAKRPIGASRVLPRISPRITGGGKAPWGPGIQPSGGITCPTHGVGHTRTHTTGWIMLPVLVVVALFHASQLAVTPRSGDTPHTAPAHMTTAVRAASPPPIDRSHADPVGTTPPPLT